MEAERHRTNQREEIAFYLHEVIVQTKYSRNRAGELCPKCRQAQLDYNGLLNLVCPHCGLIEGGVFTC